ncbi:sigma-54 interaction domain-containing protein [Sporomusa acidovorans]|uniref:Anaerobic nitric oxide reductase transcription regulator NorR n=1 Tax=Sporomusa acidovorans (strain ATCC 49682 / DSM 3132 / Mol) TaxID=1123286 RepID=A0ABZ3J1J8_SPOA4|nr:sigma 54-interacting transcriptional regulator [Sporomusa acidovorans]OZC23171.1 nitrogen regulation protein NR(I) [Sporomusa acidovorans DSM 3132]SDE96641.1 Transcriptional regulator containing PAS, AAA-type ATPase, and DNA-binding Fis domains [Sporomusa acidovorans]
MMDENNSTALCGLQFVNKERWEAMTHNKERFLRNQLKDPRHFPNMNQAVAESWVRSRKLGVNPLDPLCCKYLDSKELKIVLDKNKLLIDITENLFNSFKKLVDSTGYLLYLFDKDGVLLLVSSLLYQNTEYDWLVGNPGKVCNESTVGTCAHVLSMRYKRPVQIIGPEQYCVALKNMIGSAAPILDENGEVIATLVLNQELVNPILDSNYQTLCIHTLGLIMAMTEAIQVQIELEKNNRYVRSVNSDLRLAYDTLEATLDCIDEGIVNVNQTGQIIRMNRHGLRIFNLESNQIANRNIREFLDENSCLIDFLVKGEKTSVEEIIRTNRDEQSYIIDIHPVLNQVTCQLTGAILRFNHVKKINAMVNSRSGAMARYNFADIIGESMTMKKAIDLGLRFAGLQETILLSGESGTGKEIFAQAIHNKCCPQGPFIALNCSALPRDLIESELFGYEAGSFTGADRSGRPGKIELANGGTLFLDEIGDMPLEIQPVLLRVIENKQVMRIGGRSYKKVDFNIIAATNKDFERVMAEGLFREDLFFRLSVLTIKLPPLRERENDVEILSNYFIEKYCRKIGRQVPRVQAAAKKKILRYSWPGNVRQLENAMIYAINVSQDNIITLECLPDAVLREKSGELNGKIATEREPSLISMASWEKTAIQMALMRTNNNIPLAADLLEISKPTLYRKIKTYNIKL